jgi:hypothetical protein
MQLISNKVKARSLILAASVIGLLLVTNFGISNLSFNNQVSASLEYNDKISNSIKKVCPNFEGDGNINGLVSDLLKSCVGHSNEPPTTPGPDIEPTNFDNNIVDFTARGEARTLGPSVDIVIADKPSNKLNSYTLILDPESDPTHDNFVIPVGDRFVVNAISTYPSLDVDFSGSTNCVTINSTAWWDYG